MPAPNRGRLWRLLRSRLAIAATAFAIVLAMVGLAPTAHADLFNSRQTWLRGATTGLFLHWGMLTSPQYFDCAQWEAAVTNGGWDPNYWVTEAQKLHASYIALATFHSKLGYARPWPSAIPGSCRTQRDFLGELLTATHNAGLHLILYMTNDAKWHNLDNHEWFDSTAFSNYAGHTVDMDTQGGFGEFSYDNFLEVMQRNPTLDGFWIDNDNPYWISHNLYGQIYSLHPNMVQINNGKDRPEQDAVSMENKTGMTPAYDMPQAYTVDQPRLTEAAWKLPTSGGWYYDGSNSTVDTATTIGRIVANAGSSVKSLMDETPMINGKLPSNQANFNNFINGYLNTIWPTINGVEGGGYAYGGMRGGAWNDGAFGYTTISKSDPGTQYVHVITKPTTGSSISLRDNGYKVTSVKDFRSGARLSFSQANGFLTISGISAWDTYDTVFTVTAVGRSGIYANPGSVTATASASKSGFPASNLTDGSYVSYWDNNATLPVTITLDQGSSKKVQYLAVNQREWSPVQGSNSARIHDYKVFDSTDGLTWTQVKNGTLADARGVQFTSLSIASTRYVRLEVDTTYASSTSTRYKQLRIDEMWLGSGWAATGGPAPITIEAEASGNTLSGSVAARTCATCSGGAKVGFIGNNSQNFETIPVSVSTAGSHELTIYAEVSGTRDFFVSVNGGAGIDVPITSNDWYHPVAVTILVNLNAGSNTLKFYNNSAFAPDLDKVMVS